MVKSGELTKKISIVRKKTAKDEDGFSKETWEEHKTPWAKVNGLFGKEYWEAKKYNAENTVLFTIRYASCPDISREDRIIFHNTTFNIESVDNVMFKNEELRIKAKEVIK